MRILLSVMFICMAALSGFAQSTAAQSTTAQYQVGTIMQVKPHHVGDGGDASVTQYDISVRVGNTDYLVLFTPAYGGSAVQYKAGLGLPVLVKSDTLTIRDLLGNALEAPILARKTLPAQRVP